MDTIDIIRPLSEILSDLRTQKAAYIKQWQGERTEKLSPGFSRWWERTLHPEFVPLATCGGKTRCVRGPYA